MSCVLVACAFKNSRIAGPEMRASAHAEIPAFRIEKLRFQGRWKAWLFARIAWFVRYAKPTRKISHSATAAGYQLYPIQHPFSLTEPALTRPAADAAAYIPQPIPQVFPLPKKLNLFFRLTPVLIFVPCVSGRSTLLPLCLVSLSVPLLKKLKRPDRLWSRARLACLD